MQKWPDKILEIRHTESRILVKFCCQSAEFNTIPRIHDKLQICDKRLNCDCILLQFSSETFNYYIF